MACVGVIETNTTFCPSDPSMTDMSTGLMTGHCYCTSLLEMGSLLICLHQMNYYDDAMVKHLSKACSRSHPNITVDGQFFDAVYDNALNYAITPAPDMDPTLTCSTPIRVRAEPVRIYYQSYYNRFSNFTLTLNLGAGFIALFTAYMIVSGMSNWALIIFPGLIKKTNGPRVQKLRALFSLSATFKKDRTVPMKLGGYLFGYIPTRLETIVITFLWLYMIFACSFRFRHVRGNPMWNMKMGEIGRQVVDRSGVLALFVYPFMILFAGRNNILVYVTRWNYSRFNTYHRHMSRIFFTLSLTHSVGMVIASFGISSTTYRYRMSQAYILWGLFGTVFAGFILIQSMLILRRRSYELFLAVHIFFAIIVLVSVHCHIDSLGYGGFTWTVMGLWVLDRVIRLYRISRFGIQTATVAIISGDTLKVTVPKPANWGGKPGQYAFVSFIMPSCFWQSHPFTMITENDKLISFTILIKGGVTHGVFKHISSMPGRVANIKVAIEGPYGFSSPTQTYSQSLLLASGNGIPGLYDHAMMSSKSGAHHSVKLIWIIRDYLSITWMQEEMSKLRRTKVETVIYVTRPIDSPEYIEDFSSSNTLTSTLRGSIVSDSSAESIDSYYLGSESDAGTTYSVERDTEKKEDIYPYPEPVLSRAERARRQLPHVCFKEGRPDIDALVKEEIEQANGSLAVVTCGIANMVDSVRYALVNNLDKSLHRVDYFEELQTWA
ncbi:hypothetical protein BABINDRAFT_59356 [Babjeviella inositovora NRRL Y-12698]|uniref:FAD-binding FR-type domain-containing protein n=1 Tax=Babjeviella inositovora NRRL Y-12698 TaxID=984486 RepID=A0A1E3QTE0_9ASCO|nr:uncharacterized protein BABINDRAFT_59356 [Babjeviella inositovora NRRL Y-12698]ODQ80930.1 hypothetical protein BABINDRAFT_59356 [Babjeviella inositovora NRRL Y-12698]